MEYGTPGEVPFARIRGSGVAAGVTRAIEAGTLAVNVSEQETDLQANFLPLLS